MKREELSDIIGSIDETLVLEAGRYDSTLGGRSPERIVHMKKKRIITFALAAVLILALGAGAYAAGIFGGKVEITTTPIDHDDPAWEELLNDAPYADVMQYARWETHSNLPTAEIEAMLAEMEGKEEFSHRDFTSVSEMEEAYGIELLKLGRDECHVQCDLRLFDEEKHSADLSGCWNSYEDGVYLWNSFSYSINDPEFFSSIASPYAELGERREYEIRSLGVTAQLASAQTAERDGEAVNEISAYFSYGGIDYCFTAILDEYYTAEDKLDVTVEWLCEKLESLQTPSWVPESADPVDTAASNEELIIRYKPHDNPITAGAEAMLADKEDGEDYSHHVFASVNEAEEAYGIELLKLKSGEDEVYSCLWVEEFPIAFIEYAPQELPDEELPKGTHLFGSYSSTADGIRIFSSFYCCFNNPYYYQAIGHDFAEIETTEEYVVRSLGVTATLVSGLVDRDGQTEHLLAAHFSYKGVDYSIYAYSTPGQDISIDWFCALLETLHE